MKYFVRDTAGAEHEVDATDVVVSDDGRVTFTKSGKPVASFANPPSWTAK